MACRLSSVIIVPPYLFFEFHELLPAVFEGGEQKPPVEIGLALVEEHRDLPDEPREHVGDNPEVPEIFALGPLFQHPGIRCFLPRMEGLEDENRVAHHVLSLPVGGLLIMAKEQGHLPGGKGCFGEILREGQSMLRYCARNGRDHPGGGPRGDRAFADQLYKILGEGIIKSKPGRHPALFTPHHGGDPALREMAAVMKLLKDGRLLDDIPFSAVSPGEDLHEGLFLFAVPDLRHHRVSSASLQGLHPEIAVEQDKGPRDDHGDDLAETLDGGGQGEALPGSLYTCMGIAEMKLPYFDLPDLPNHGLTPGGGTDLRSHPRIRKNGTSDNRQQFL